MGDNETSEIPEDSAGSPEATDQPPKETDAPDAFGPKTYSFVMSRSERRRLNVGLLLGNLLDVPADVYVLGVFEGITALGGAAGIVDQALDGAIGSLLEDRQITGRAGEVIMLPVPRYVLRTSMVAVIGLGPPGDAEDIRAAIRLAWRNLLRRLCIADVASVATILMGANSGLDEREIVNVLFEGIVESLNVHDPDRTFSKIFLCEYDLRRARKLEDHLATVFARFGRHGLEIVLNVDRVKAPALVRTAAAPRDLDRNQPNVIQADGQIIEDDRGKVLELRTHFTPGAGRRIWKGTGSATAATSRREIPLRLLDDLVARLSQVQERRKLKPLADELSDLIFEDAARENLEIDPAHPLAVVNTPWASRVPWELLHFNGEPVALGGGLSRQYRPESAPVSRARSRQVSRGTPDDPRELMLLLSDPTNNLQGARTEALELTDLVARDFAEFRLETLAGSRATLEAVTGYLAPALDQPPVKLLHYAGHAFFDPENRARSGLLLHGEDVLIGQEISKLASVPRFVFLNACESARVRRFKAAEPAAPEVSDYVSRSIGLAEAFIVAGVSNMIGTIWPVGDSDAVTFAKYFYATASEADLGTAVREARHALDQKKRATWVNYVFYGDPASRI